MSQIDEKALELSKSLEAEMAGTEMKVMTGYSLADAIREGSTVSTQEYGWGCGSSACALTAAVIAARSRKFL
jgi:hypothetical protein